VAVLTVPSKYKSNRLRAEFAGDSSFLGSIVER
jgi:hypothetical protein